MTPEQERLIRRIVEGVAEHGGVDLAVDLLHGLFRNGEWHWYGQGYEHGKAGKERIDAQGREEW